MEWIKSSIETTSESIEAVTGLLMSCGINGVEIIDAKERARYFASHTRNWDYADESLLKVDTDRAYVVFYVTADAAGKELITQVKARISTNTCELGNPQLRQESANDETWLHEWKKHFKPIRIGRVVVVPEWEEFVPENQDDVVFVIDPGSAFGTGQHQTTQLCIDALQQWVKSGDRVLDIGCGSGILSIISLLLRASFAYAIDIDPAGAIAATKKNAELNPVDLGALTIAAGDVLTEHAVREAIGNGYDIVVANIVADVIIPLAPLVGSFARESGLFIASGIITERLDEVLTAFEHASIDIVAQRELEGWHCIVGRFSHA